MPTFRFATAALVLALGSLCASADWPQWRGPNGTGTADSNLPPKDSLLWKVALPDKGNGSPVIVDGKVFLQTAPPDGSLRTLVCLNAADGKTLWSTSHDSENARSHPKATLTANTPAADGTAVYCVWWDGSTISLRAYDPKTGKERWAAPLGMNQTQHGAHYSPVVSGGTVFVNVDQDSTAEFLAFDTKTGKKVWSVERTTFRANYTLPVLFERAGKATELIVSNSKGIDSYDPKSGKVNWSYPITWPKGSAPQRLIGAPQFTNGLLVANAGDSAGSRYTFAITPGGSGDISATATVWKAQKDTPYIPGIVARGEHLFWVTDRGHAGCAEVKTGRLVWSELVFEKSDVTASLVLLKDGALAVSDKGRVATWKAAKEFEQIDAWELGERVIASPAVANGRVYIRGDAHLFCYGKK